jgi:hypothetical protein
MNATTTPETTVDGVPAMVNAALDRLRAEQRRACQLLADAPKCQRLSALYEQEARCGRCWRSTPPNRSIGVQP